MKKDCPYIFLPTDKASKIYLQNGKMCYDETIVERIKDCNDQHVYVLSDETPKENDWVYGMDGLFQYKGKVNIPDVELPKKIIATTNPELIYAKGIVVDGFVASISQSDIEFIISLYNGKDKLKVARNVLSADKRFSEKDLDNVMFGYELALQDNADKKFTLDDMNKAIDMAMGFRNLPDNGLPVRDNIIQILTNSRPKRDTVMVEYEETHEPYPDKFYPTASKSVWRPKLKDGCIVIIK